MKLFFNQFDDELSSSSAQYSPSIQKFICGVIAMIRADHVWEIGIDGAILNNSLLYQVFYFVRSRVDWKKEIETKKHNKVNIFH